jgi:hypothetical protein
LLGLTGKTDLGFSTKNNVQGNQIQRVSSNIPKSPPPPPKTPPQAPANEYQSAGLPNPNDSNFCLNTINEFGQGISGFRKGALKYHPDRCGDTSEAKKLCTEIFKALSACYGR